MPEGEGSSHGDAPSGAWRFRLAVVLVCAGVGLLSVLLGPDNNWDLRYYHLYAPWAYLHGRYLFDIGPAQSQGFFNPTADFLFYGLISSPLNQTPRVIAFIMGVVHGVNAALIFAIASHVLRPAPAWERATLTTVALLMGVSGAGFISLLGTTTNDLINSIFVLGALLGLIQVAERPGGGAEWPGFAWSGLLAGVGVGLKYTTAVFVPGLALVAIVAAVRQRTVGGAIAFGLMGALGFVIVAGHHLLTLWQAFGNPVFPFLNQIFQSPYYEAASLRDDRFVPGDIRQMLAFPFYWTRVTRYVVAELPFRDWRGAIAYVAIVAGALAFAAGFARARWRRDGLLAETRGLGLVVTFVVVSFVVWELAFGIYRYAVTLEMLTGVVTVGVLIRLVRNSRPRASAAIALLAIAAVTTVHLDWGRGRFGGRYVEVDVPPLPANSVVLIATWDPVAYFIPFAEPSAQYLGIDNNYLEFDQDNKLVAEIRRIMAMPGRAKFLLKVDEFDREDLADLFEELGLTLAPEPCRPIRSNLEVHALSLCPLTDQPAGRDEH